MVKIRIACLFITLAAVASLGIGYILGMSAVKNQFVNANIDNAVLEMSNMPPALPPTLKTEPESVQPEP